MKNNSNKGMLLESIINTSILYYELNNIAIFRKNFPHYKILKVNEEFFYGKFIKKADVDYYGIYNGNFYCFEAKQTINDKFYLDKILVHQNEFMKKILSCNGLCYLILYFTKHEQIYKISYQKIINTKLKSIDILWCKKYGEKLELLFPGRIEII